MLNIKKLNAKVGTATEQAKTWKSIYVNVPKPLHRSQQATTGRRRYI